MPFAVITCWILVCAIPASSGVQLTPPNPRVFGGLVLSGINSSEGELSIAAAGRSLLCKLPPAPNITVPCRCLPFVSSKYRLQDDRSGTTLKEFAVGPPKIMIIVPDEHRLLTGLETIFEPELCEAHVFEVSMEFRPFEVVPGREDAWEAVSNGRILLSTKREIRDFSCEDFEVPGFYRIRLVSSLDANTTVVSTVIKANISSSVPPSIHMRSDSIFPHCNGEFTVSWKIPHCPRSKLGYRIRAFAVEEERPDELILMDDSAVNRSTTSVGIPCSYFDIIYRQFCFELVTITDHTRRFVHWDQKCVYTENLKRIDGGWSTWTEWSQCTVTCSSGIQRRVRYCNNPVTLKGTTCQGEFVESRDCDEQDCPVTKRNVQIHQSDCDCGCQLLARSGSFFAGLRHCEKRKIEWVIPADGGRQVKITVANHTKSGEVLRITNRDLLLDSRIHSADREVSVNLDAAVAIVFYTRRHHKDSAGNRSETASGFIVDYLITERSNRRIVFENVRSEASIAPFDCPICSLPFVAAFLSVVFIAIILLPPILCTIVTKRKIERRLKKRSTSNSRRNPSEMVRSSNTETTRASVEVPLKTAVSKRSIGIQLSVQSTPRFPRGPTRNPSVSARGTPRDQHGSSLSFANFGDENEELEYDYYDYQNRFDDFASEIDIDQIISANAPWALQASGEEPRVATSDANTQI